MTRPSMWLSFLHRYSGSFRCDLLPFVPSKARNLPSNPASSLPFSMAHNHAKWSCTGFDVMLHELQTLSLDHLSEPRSKGRMSGSYAGISDIHNCVCLVWASRPKPGHTRC